MPKRAFNIFHYIHQTKKMILITMGLLVAQSALTQGNTEYEQKIKKLPFEDQEYLMQQIPKNLANLWWAKEHCKSPREQALIKKTVNVLREYELFLTSYWNEKSWRQRVEKQKASLDAQKLSSELLEIECQELIDEQSLSDQLQQLQEWKDILKK